MAGEESKLQYQAFSDHRLHFSRLFMQVAAFMLLIVLGAAAVAPPMYGLWFYPAAGVALIGTAFVLLRVSQQEDSYARLLRTIEERDPGMLRAPLSARYGARMFVVASFVIAGAALIAVGLTEL